MTLDGNALLHWIELALPEPPWLGDERFVGFVYMDWEVGMSAKGWADGDPTVVEKPRLTVRLPMGVTSRLIPDDEAAARGLPERPPWLETFGPQPAKDAAWRRDPALAPRAHKQFPDDVPVLVHDGEPAHSGRRTEVCWVRIDGVTAGPPRPSERAPGEAVERATDVYEGVLLSEPHQLATWQAGARVRFVADAGGRHAVAVSDDYLAERPGWIVTACTRCGLSEGLEPPLAMFRARFGDGDEADEAVAFTAFCPVCGRSGVRTFRRVGEAASR